jgi:hypothetical protein
MHPIQGKIGWFFLLTGAIALIFLLAPQSSAGAVE